LPKKIKFEFRLSTYVCQDHLCFGITRGTKWWCETRKLTHNLIIALMYNQQPYDVMKFLKGLKRDGLGERKENEHEEMCIIYFFGLGRSHNSVMEQLTWM
jgi:hypothetical protein